jgi:hypothetical protein
VAAEPGAGLGVDEGQLVRGAVVQDESGQLTVHVDLITRLVRMISDVFSHKVTQPSRVAGSYRTVMA